MTDLGALAEGDSSAYGINNHGQVVGCISSSNGAHAVLWEKGRMIDLQVPGWNNCAYGINDLGQVVGTYYPENPSYHSEHVFLWENGRLANLNPGTEAGALLPAINNRGEVIWSAYSGNGFRWSAGATTDLRSVSGSQIQASSINDRGQIAGTLNYFDYPTYNYIPYAVRLDPKTLVAWTPDGSVAAAGGWVQDDVYGMRAALYVPPGVVPAGARLDVEIRVFEDPPNLRIPAVYRPGTFFTDVLPTHDAGVLLGSTTQGFVAHLPLAAPLPAGMVLQLLRPHPFTGSLLPVSGVTGKWVYGTVDASGSAAEFRGIAGLSTPYTSYSTFVGLVPAAALGDVNGDGKVDCTDLRLLKASFGKRSGQPGFDPNADLNSNGIVDLNDLVLIARQLPSGTSCQ
jgi:probable HAF family extracellular repeat protein